MKNSPVTFTLSTYNNLEYLKLAIESVRKYAYFKKAPFIVHAENCTDGTNEWLSENAKKYNLDIYIEPVMVPARGIGGGMNFSISKAKTEYVIPLQSDFYVSKDFDLALYNIIEQTEDRTVVSSFRVQPNIFGNPVQKPGNLFLDLDTVGAFWTDFKPKRFLELAVGLSTLNDFTIRRCEGAGGFIIRKKDWDYIGGNDSLFAPTSWEDIDLFVRMQNEGFNFIQTTKSIIWHFAGRGSHRLEENQGQSSERQVQAEQRNAAHFIMKWGQYPEFDEMDFVKPIYNPSVPNKIIYNIETNTSTYDFTDNSDNIKK